MTESGLMFIDNLRVYIRIEDARFETMIVKVNKSAYTVDVGHIHGDVVKGIDEVESEVRRHR